MGTETKPATPTRAQLWALICVVKAVTLKASTAGQGLQDAAYRTARDRALAAEWPAILEKVSVCPVVMVELKKIPHASQWQQLKQLGRLLDELHAPLYQIERQATIESAIVVQAQEALRAAHPIQRFLSEVLFFRDGQTIVTLQGRVVAQATRTTLAHKVRFNPPDLIAWFGHCDGHPEWVALGYWGILPPDAKLQVGVTSREEFQLPPTSPT